MVEARRKVTKEDYGKSPVRLTKNLQIGATVILGKFPQGKNEKETPIEWLVLDIVEDRVLLISKHGLIAKPYNDKKQDVTWQTCTLRTWLNSTFYRGAFTDRERANICLTTVHNMDNPEHHTVGGENTEDKIFLLSLEEAEEYFEDRRARKSSSTEYAVKSGAITAEMYKRYVLEEYKDDKKLIEYMEEEYDTDTTLADGSRSEWWWLRSPGAFFDCASDVDIFGGFIPLGGYVSNVNVCVRPAFWYNL